MPDNEVTQQVGLSKDAADATVDAITRLNVGLSRIEQESKRQSDYVREISDQLNALSHAQEAAGVAIDSQGNIGGVAVYREVIDKNNELFERILASDEDMRVYEAAKGKSISEIKDMIESEEREIKEVLDRVERARQILEEEKAIAKEQLDEQKETKKTIREAAEEVANRVSSNLENLGKEVKGIRGGVQDIFKADNPMDAAKAVGELVGKLKLNAGSPLAPLAFLVAGSELYKGGTAAYQGLQDTALKYGLDSPVEAAVLGADLNVQSTITGYATGLSSEEIRGMQESLLNNKIKFGSGDYDMGYQFAVGARQKYGIGGDQSIRMFTNAVVNGTKTMSELQDTMRNLEQTAKESNKTMAEVMEGYESSVKTLTEVTGSEIVGEELALTLSQYLDSDTAAKVTETIQKVGSAEGYNELVEQYIQEGYGDKAYVAAADMFIAQNGKGFEADALRILMGDGSEARVGTDIDPSIAANMLEEQGLINSENTQAMRRYIQGAFEEDPEGFRQRFGLRGNEGVNDIADPKRVAEIYMALRGDEVTGVGKLLMGENAREEIGEYRLDATLKPYNYEVDELVGANGAVDFVFNEGELNQQMRVGLAKELKETGLISPSLSDEDAVKYADTLINDYNASGNASLVDYVTQNITDIVGSSYGNQKYEARTDTLNIVIETDDEALKRKFITWKRDDELNAGKN